MYDVRPLGKVYCVDLCDRQKSLMKRSLRLVGSSLVLRIRVSDSGAT